MKKKLNEAEYNLSITDLNTNDGDTLSQIIAMANQADNGGMGEVAPEVAPVDPYEDGMVGDTAVDTPFDTIGDEMPVEDDPTTDEMGYGVPADAPVEEPAPVENPEDDMAGINLDDYAEFGIDENDFNQEEPYTSKLPDEDSILTEDEGKSGYSVMVKDKEYAHIDTDKEYSDEEIITEFLKQYMAKTGKEFPYADQIVIQRTGEDVEEDVLLPKDDENEFIPEDESHWMLDDDEDSDMNNEALEEELNQIKWAAGVKGCSDKEEKGVKKESLIEDNSSNTFQNLSDEKVQELYKKYKEQGLSDDEIFDKIYSEDCNLDEAKAAWKPTDENPKVNAMTYLDDDVKQVYDLFQTGEYTPSEIFSMLKDAGVSYQRAREIVQDWISGNKINESEEKPEMNLEDCDAPNPAEMNLDDKEKIKEATDKGVDMNAFLDKFNKEYDFLYKNNDRVAGYSEARDYFDEWVKKPESKEFMKKFFDVRGDFVSSDREAAAFAFALESFGLLESAYSPKLKDPNRKKPTQPNYVDVNINADAKSGTLGFEYPAPTSGKISLSPKAGKIMETAKHLIGNAEGNKKEKLQSRFVFKLMNEGVSYSDAKKIVSRF